jgi:hypothetical protein
VVVALPVAAVTLIFLTCAGLSVVVVTLAGWVVDEIEARVVVGAAATGW